MPTFDCQNLTQTLSQLREIKSKADLAITSMTPDTAAELPAEAGEIIDCYDLLLRLGHRNLAYFIEKLGSFEELQSRITTVELGSQTETKLRERIYGLDQNGQRRIKTVDNSRTFSNEKGVTDGIIDSILQSDEFKSRQGATKRIRLIRLSIRELGASGQASYSNLLKHAKEHDCVPCPAEAILLLKMKDLVDEIGNVKYFAAMRLALAEGRGRILHISYNNIGDRVVKIGNTDLIQAGNLNSFQTFVFALPDLPIRS